MLTKVTLYGDLAEKYGKHWDLSIKTPAEAIRALSANNSGFRSDLLKKEAAYIVKVSGKSIGEEELLNPLASYNNIKIIPVIAGADKLGKILLGAALIYIGINPSVVGGLSVGVATALVSIGVSLVIGGVAELLAKPPELAEAEDSFQSFSFNGVSNTVTQGLPVPICYGQLLVGGATISSGAASVNYVPE
jgi:predicted phage tail protein